MEEKTKSKKYMIWQEMYMNGLWSPATLTSELAEEAVTIVQVPTFQFPTVAPCPILLAAATTSVFASLYS